ncbi:MAG: hypothetical protein ACOYM7_04225 [Paludibacter sp.]
MNRKLLVTLLHKNIEELGMITESFLEMNEYPKTIIQLAKRKTEDIQTILDELGGNKEMFESVKNTDIKQLDELAEDIIVEKEPIEIVEPIVIPELISTPEPIEIKVHETPTVVEPIVEETSFIEIQMDETETITETTIEQTIEIEENNDTTETTLTTETIVTETITHSEETKIITVADKMAQHAVSRNEKLSQADNSLSASLANKKITDIKQAISIGDRFRFQRELFKSNGEDMNKTLSYINQLATLNEAMSFLKSKYSWEETNETVEDFYQIVKRKFV